MSEGWMMDHEIKIVLLDKMIFFFGCVCVSGVFDLMPKMGIATEPFIVHPFLSW